MKILNLTNGFDPCGSSPEQLIEYKRFVFSGGEPHIQVNGLDPDAYPKGVDVIIAHRIASFSDMGLLMVAVDALWRTGNVNSISLVLPYFPGARQDRVMNSGEPLTVKVYADIINAMGFSEVTIFDPHSDVVAALLDNVTVINNHNFVDNAISLIENEQEAIVHIISPDSGANKKATALAKYLEVFNLIKCDKTRDVATGDITGFEVYANDLNGKHCVIVDDICDGGGTFIGLAKELKAKNAGKLYLVVSHGIFSKGFKELNKYFELIVTTDSFPNIDDDYFSRRWDNNTHKVRQIKLSDVL